MDPINTPLSHVSIYTSTMDPMGLLITHQSLLLILLAKFDHY